MRTEEPVHDTTWQGVRSPTDTLFTGKESISTGWHTAEGLIQDRGKRRGVHTRSTEDRPRIMIPGISDWIWKDPSLEPRRPISSYILSKV